MAKVFRRHHASTELTAEYVQYSSSVWGIFLGQICRDFISRDGRVAACIALVGPHVEEVFEGNSAVAAQ